MNKIKLLTVCAALCIALSCASNNTIEGTKSVSSRAGSLLESVAKAYSNKIKNQNAKEKAAKNADKEYDVPKEVAQILMPPGYSDKIINDMKKGIKPSKPRVSIAKFDSNVTLDMNIDELKMDELLQTALQKTGRFEFFNQLEYDAQIGQQRLFNSDEFVTTNKNGQSVAEIGQTEAAAYMVTCSVTSATKEITDEYAFYKFKAKLTFNVNVTDLTTGTLYKAVQGEGVAAVKLFLDDRGNVIKGPVALRSARIVKNGTKYDMVGVDMAVQFTEAAQAAINNCAEQLENMFPLVGYCMGKYNESDKTIKVNLGSNQGLNDGDYLIVIRADEDEDPFTGEKFYETRPIASAQAQGVGDESANITMINIKENPNRGDFVVSISRKRGN